MEKEKVSIVYLPVKLTRQEIESVVNRLIKGIIYEDEDMDDDGLMVKAEKSKNIKLEINDQLIRYRVPLSIWLKKDIGLTNIEADGEIAITLASKYEIGEDWQIVTKTEVLTHEWLTKPKMKLGFIDFPIKYIADKIMERSKNLISRSLDEQLAQRFNFRDRMKELWSLLQQPIALNKEPAVWIEIQPELLSMLPLQVEKDMISSQLLIRAYANARIGKQSDSILSTALPPFKYSMEREQDFFKIQLGASVSYEEAEQLSRQYLIGKTYVFGNRSITVETFNLEGNENKLMLDANVSGTYNGRILIDGQLVYDHSQGQIEFKISDVELKTDNKLVSGIGWLFKNTLKRRLAEALIFPLQQNIERIKKLVQYRLDNYKITENLSLSGKMETIEMHDLKLTKKGVEALLSSEGKLTIKMNVDESSLV